MLKKVNAEKNHSLIDFSKRNKDRRGLVPLGRNPRRAWSPSLGQIEIDEANCHKKNYNLQNLLKIDIFNLYHHKKREYGYHLD